MKKNIFPQVYFKYESSDKGLLVVPYFYKGDKCVIKFSSSSKTFSKIYKVLPTKKGEKIHALIDDRTYLFVNVSENNFEEEIVKVIKNVLLDGYDDVEVLTDGYVFYDKLLVSKTIFDLKNNWSLKTTKSTNDKQKTITFIGRGEIDNGKNLAEIQSFVQELVNRPSNFLTPTIFANLVVEYIKEHKLDKKISCKIYGKKEIKKMKMGAFYAVAKGSNEEPKIIVLEYNGSRDKEEKPVVLVGKGVTFDSGGISLKPSLSMGDMKGDMAGAATAIGSVLYAAKQNLNINTVAVAACCENMPSGKSLKPGDVIKAMNGTTIEVVDTDAEGRLVLADALEFSKRFNGLYTIDLATLTGACIAALGYSHTGLFSNDEYLIDELLASSKKIKDLVWRLPMEDDHEVMLESKIADISNLCIGKGAGAQNGAIFLKRFAPKEGWCHLDIAGTSMAKGEGATSRPMPLMSEFLDGLSFLKEQM